MKFVLALILTLTLAVTASAGHGGFFASRNNLQAARLNAKAAQFNAKAAQLNAGNFYAPQAFIAPQRIYVPAQQQFNSGCNNGALQFNAGGCGQLYR
jgi:hypothetical protein